MQYHIALAVVFFIGMYLTPAWASQCYVCDGGDGSACYDKFNKDDASVLKIDSPSGWCVKVKAVTSSVKTVSRRVGDTTTCSKTSCEKITGPGGEATQCCCNSDLCNSTVRLSSTMVLGMFLSFFVLTLKKLMF